MATKNPRIHAVLEPPLYELMQELAKQEGLSLSEAARDLIREALELREDRALDAFASARRRTFDTRKALSVDELRKSLRAVR